MNCDLQEYIKIFYINIIFILLSSILIISCSYDMKSPWGELTIHPYYEIKACEPIHINKFARSPWNTYSNLPFLWCFFYIILINNKTIFYIQAFSVFCLFITSFLFHASISLEINTYDSIMMYMNVFMPVLIVLYILVERIYIILPVYIFSLIILSLISVYKIYSYINVLCVLLSINLVIHCVLFYKKKMFGNKIYLLCYLLSIIFGFLNTCMVIFDIVDCRNRNLQPLFTFPFHPLISLGILFSYHYYDSFIY